MDEYLHFDGDPEIDSQRRHLERVIKGYPPRRRWPWILAAVAGGGAWAVWRNHQRRPTDRQAEQAAPDGTPKPANGVLSGSSDPAARS